MKAARDPVSALRREKSPCPVWTHQETTANQCLAEELEKEELVLWDFVSSCPCEELFGFR